MLQYAVLVDRGLVHETNDDAALLDRNLIDEGFFIGKKEIDEALFAVADGVGSLKMSEIASRIALRTIADCDPRNEEHIWSCLEKANQLILSEMERLQLYEGLSSTLCIASVLKERIVSFNLGNSRLYRHRNGVLQQLTKDQTKVQMLVDTGLLRMEDMEGHPESHLLTSFIGHREFDLSWVDRVEHSEKFELGDCLLLCSDGLHEHVDIDQMEDIMNANESPGDIVRKMVNAAKQQGGEDNITALVVKKTDGRKERLP